MISGDAVRAQLLVSQPDTGEPLSRPELRSIFLELLERGLLVMPSGSSLRINPPLVLTREQAEVGCAILEDVLARVPTGVATRA